MIRPVLAIAQLTLREALRRRVFVNLAVFAALMFGTASSSGAIPLNGAPAFNSGSTVANRQVIPPPKQ